MYNISENKRVQKKEEKVCGRKVKLQQVLLLLDWYR